MNLPITVEIFKPFENFLKHRSYSCLIKYTMSTISYLNFMFYNIQQTSTWNLTQSKKKLLILNTNTTLWTLNKRLCECQLYKIQHLYHFLHNANYEISVHNFKFQRQKIGKNDSKLIDLKIKGANNNPTFKEPQYKP